MRDRKRFNVIDVMIICCAALIILATVFRTQVIGFLADRENLSEFTVTFETEPIPGGYSGYILAPNTTVEWVEAGKTLGTVNGAVESRPAPVYTIGVDGRLIITESEEQILRGTLRVMAADRNGCFISGTEFVGAGMDITLRVPNAVFKATILSVT